MTNEARRDDSSTSEEITTADLAGVRDQQGRRQIEIDSRTPEPQSTSEPRENAAPVGTSTGVAAVRAKTEEDPGPLFSSQEANNLRARWDSIQVAFVDEPRQAVEDADRLVASTMKRLAEIFADERQMLEHQWDRGDNVSTEDLRVSLRHYRSFFSRLLKV